MSKIQQAIRKSVVANKTSEALRPEDYLLNREQQGLRQPVVASDDSLSRLKLQVAPADPRAIRRNRIVSDTLNRSAKSAFNMLRTRVLQRMRSNGWHSIALTSCGPGDGKSLTSINLAMSMARQGGERVVLFDFDLRRPSIIRNLGMQGVECDLSDYIAERASANEIMVSPAIDNLWVIPNSTRYEDSSEVLASNRISQLINDVRSFDPNCLLVFDLPPLLAADDALVFTPLVDALILVIAEGNTSRENLRYVKEIIHDHSLELLGTILNKSSGKNTPYY